MPRKSATEKINLNETTSDEVAKVKTTQSQDKEAIQNLIQADRSIQDRLPRLAQRYDVQLSQVEKQLEAIRKATAKLQSDVEELEKRLNDQLN